METISNQGVSVVILTYNTPIDLLQTCITAILKYNDIADLLEIIVVDNNSTNQPQINNFLNSLDNGITIINNTQNSGYGAGNNLGIKRAKYETVILINPDVELVEPIFLWGKESFKNNEDLKLLGLQQIDQFGKPTHAFLMRELSVTNFLIHFYLNKKRKFSAKYAVISGACFFLRKSSFLKVGGYDENIFLYGEERYLHELILKSFPTADIHIDNSKKYQHPISDRKFSLKIIELGLNSYFYLRNILGFEKAQTFKQVKSYYRFLTLFYLIKNKKSAIQETRQTLDLLIKKFT